MILIKIILRDKMIPKHIAILVFFIIWNIRKYQNYVFLLNNYNISKFDFN